MLKMMASLTVTDTSIVNGHVESRFSMKTGVWTEPAFVRDPVLRIHGLAPALHYGETKQPAEGSALEYMC